VGNPLGGVGLGYLDYMMDEMSIVVYVVVYSTDVFIVEIFIVYVVLSEYVLPVITEYGFFLFWCVVLCIVLFEVGGSLFCVGTYHAL
jgi:hypothetical protein